MLSEDVLGEDTFSKVENLAPGEILLLENLRFDKREMENDRAFCEQLASLADIYINDAFGVSHREHSSVYGIMDFF